jgi:hypothetical protein
MTETTEVRQAVNDALAANRKGSIMAGRLMFDHAFRAWVRDQLKSAPPAGEQSVAGRTDEPPTL